MISHYTAIVFISIISMLIMILGAQSNCFMPKKQKRSFQLLFFLLILCNFSEWAAFYLNGNTNFSRIFLTSVKFTEFVLAPVIPILCANAIGGDKKIKAMSILALINTVLEIISIFTGIVFFIDSANVYHRGILYNIYIGIAACSILFLIIHCVEFGKRYQFNNILFLFLILLFAAGFSITENVVIQLNLDWTCVSIATIMFYIYYDQLVQQVDDMTTLLNRRSYNCRIEEFYRPAAILFFDVDDFKYINDTYGHSFGDKCLIVVSLEIRRAFEKYGYCYRIGGDEFCVIMTCNLENTEEIILKYLKRLGDIRKREARLPKVSIGYSLFNPFSENIDEAIKRADKIMYNCKKRNSKKLNMN